MLKKVLPLSTVLAAIFCIYSAATAFAHYYSGGYSLYSMSYNVVYDGTSYPFNKAAQNWGDAVGTNIYQSSSSPNDCYYSSYSYSWYGFYDPSYLSNGSTGNFDIFVNERTLKNDFYDYVSAAVSSATHEFGHAQYLDDLESGWGNYSIMSYERNREVILKPQQHDIDDINSYR